MEKTTLADFMKKELPFGEAAYSALSTFNTKFGDISTTVIDYLFILFKDGTPNYPAGITSNMKGDKDDPRVNSIMQALIEYETEYGSSLHLDILPFLLLFLLHLKIPIDHIDFNKNIK
jgi:hypothetical protein